LFSLQNFFLTFLYNGRRFHGIFCEPGDVCHALSCTSICGATIAATATAAAAAVVVYPRAAAAITTTTTTAAAAAVAVAAIVAPHIDVQDKA
jgi:hypothetical protein